MNLARARRAGARLEPPVARPSFPPRHNFDWHHSSRCLISLKRRKQKVCPGKVAPKRARPPIAAAPTSPSPVACEKPRRDGACRAAKKAPLRAGLEIRSERRSFLLRARRLVPITAQGVSVRDAHVAALVGAGSAMPFPWLVCIGGPLNVIGRRTRPRCIGEPGAGPGARRGASAIARGATVFSLLGISL